LQNQEGVPVRKFPSKFEDKEIREALDAILEEGGKSSEAKL
jgi:hypothetical protein